MTKPIKPTAATAMARTPKEGWDANIDKRRAWEFLTGTEAEISLGDGFEESMGFFIRMLRAIGIRPRTAVAMLHRHFHRQISHYKDFSVEDIMKLTKAIYTNESDAPGLQSAAGEQVPDDLAFKTKAGKVDASEPKNMFKAMMRLGVKLSFDSFTNKAMIEGLEGFGPILDDAAINQLRFVFNSKYDFLPNKDLAFDYLEFVARGKSFDPVLEYFAEAQSAWDKTPRIDRFLIDYAGVEDSPYVRAVSALLFLSIVRRNRQPGAKYDEMQVWESTQGKNKSEALEILAIKKDWFSDSFSMTAQNRETLEHTEGKLIIEIAELQGMRKADLEHVKAMLSRKEDRGRKVWNRKQTESPRRFTFIGTSNNDSYLKDNTGNRRFWPVKVKEFKLKDIRHDLKQLWGEAADREANGESIRLDPSLWEAAGIEQEKRMDTNNDAFTESFRNHLGDMEGRITTEDAWKLLGFDDARNRTGDASRRFGAALRLLGWRHGTLSVDGKKVSGYARGAAATYGPRKGNARRILVWRDKDKFIEVGYEQSGESEWDDTAAEWDDTATAETAAQSKMMVQSKMANWDDTDEFG